MRIKLWVWPIPYFVAAAWTFSPVEGCGQAIGVPKEVRALEGTYTGAWTMYGIDGKGDIVKRMAWTDTMKAVNSEIQGDRAFCQYHR